MHSLALLSPNQIFNFYFLKSVAKNFVMLFFSRLMERNDLLVEFLFFFSDKINSLFIKQIFFFHLSTEQAKPQL